MKLIVAVDKNWGIGYQNELLVHIPGDLKRFKYLTLSSPIGKRNGIIMGRKTFESIGKLLPDRYNFILSRKGISFDPKLNTDQTPYSCLPTIENIFDQITLLGIEETSFVIGGAEVYKQLIDYCSGLYVTKVDYTFDKVDTYFPIDLDRDDRFSLIDQSLQYRYKDYYYSFCEYIQPKYKKIGEYYYGESITRRPASSKNQTNQ